MTTSYTNLSFIILDKNPFVKFSSLLNPYISPYLQYVRIAIWDSLVLQKYCRKSHRDPQKFIFFI